VNGMGMRERKAQWATDERTDVS